ncbi:MAG: hypothetical protein HN772_03535 [Euryarchaeota archaeon]|nr:hypothetical protein [Euryarchaeota archaeon]
MQRRRRPKVEPRNVFGGNLPPRPVKKTPIDRNKNTTKTPKVPDKNHIPKPVRKVIPLPNTKIEHPIKEIEKDIISDEKIVPLIDSKEESIEENVVISHDITEAESVIEQQILGHAPKKGIGLKKKNAIVAPEIEILPSTKAMELIEKSRIRANVISTTKETAAKLKAKPAAVIRKPRPRSRQKNYQPATRLKRLDRSKHMEYKYEMRSLLIKLNVAEEYRSNMLASIWAKGERQSIQQSREYITEKLDEGIIDESQHKSLSKIIDNYTTRR